jgi:hypothetical protein
LNFNCNVRIVDEIMGKGKSFSAINYINSFSDEDVKFLVITPYLDEIKRYKEKCVRKCFKQPMYNNSSKIDNLKELVNKEENIVATHALFQRFDNELIDMCRAKNYILIMDEVANVVEEYPISKSDFEILKQDFIYIDDMNLIRWEDDKSDYRGEFSNIKRLCDLGSLSFYSGSVMMWLFPISAFNAFRNIYILTYMFNAQMQRYYYDYYGLPYKYVHVSGDNPDNYHFTDFKDTNFNDGIDYRSLINIVDNEKLNRIGDRETDLSMSWFERNKGNVALSQLKKNITNFFRNIREDKASDNIWTTFKDYKKFLQGKGYTKGFLAINTRATNEYRSRTSIAYVANKYMNPVVKNFFTQHGVATDEDGYALSEMLQFIWRSAIRDGKDIWIYIPSIRMRNLLKRWISENSIEFNEII